MQVGRVGGEKGTGKGEGGRGRGRYDCEDVWKTVIIQKWKIRFGAGPRDKGKQTRPAFSGMRKGN